MHCGSRFSLYNIKFKLHHLMGRKYKTLGSRGEAKFSFEFVDSTKGSPSKYATIDLHTFFFFFFLSPQARRNNRKEEIVERF